MKRNVSFFFTSSSPRSFPIKRPDCRNNTLKITNNAKMALIFLLRVYFTKSIEISNSSLKLRNDTGSANSILTTSVAEKPFQYTTGINAAIDWKALFIRPKSTHFMNCTWHMSSFIPIPYLLWWRCWFKLQMEYELYKYLAFQNFYRNLYTLQHHRMNKVWYGKQIECKFSLTFIIIVN